MFVEISDEEREFVEVLQSQFFKWFEHEVHRHYGADCPVEVYQKPSKNQNRAGIDRIDQGEASETG